MGSDPERTPVEGDDSLVEVARGLPALDQLVLDVVVLLHRPARLSEVVAVLRRVAPEGIAGQAWTTTRLRPIVEPLLDAGLVLGTDRLCAAPAVRRPRVEALAREGRLGRFAAAARVVPDPGGHRAVFLIVRLGDIEAACPVRDAAVAEALPGPNGPELPAVSERRLVWLLTWVDATSRLEFEPRAQKRGARGWTRGRPVALKRLYAERHTFDMLLPHDLELLRPQTFSGSARLGSKPTAGYTSVHNRCSQRWTRSRSIRAYRQILHLLSVLTSGHRGSEALCAEPRSQ